MDRAEIVHENFVRRVCEGDLPKQTGTHTLADAGLSPAQLIELFQCQVLSRHLDRIARKLQARGEAFYTIGSSGHEGTAGIAKAFRPTDMAFLHYRDAAFQIARARQVPGQTPLWDMLLSFTSSMEDPISGGRHKVLGSKALTIPPQTSTVASHLPKAVGAAYSIGLAKRCRPEHQVLPDDAVILCSFGDASLNHSTAQGALNAACWTAFQNIPLPLVFVCEDNGIGISVKTPPGWVEATLSSRTGLKYFKCSGVDVVETYAVASQVAQWVRANRAPAILHMTCVRLYGHAGADVQTAYMSMQSIEEDEANDPLLHTARRLTSNGIIGTQEVIAIYNELGAETERTAEAAVKRPKLKTAAQVMASIAPPKRICAPDDGRTSAARMDVFGGSDRRAVQKPQHMAKLINLALTDLMLEHREIVVAGEDVGRKGGVYGVTNRLQQRFGANRVIDTLLDEQSILGLAIGLAHNGFIPIPEIQFLAFLHNAEDQLRGEAATLPFFSNGQFTNPMVVRIPGLGYQRGFGGHFHNDNSLAVLRDIPGLVIACPSNGADAVQMLRECVRLARQEQRVVVFVEPIALYMTRDLHGKDDGLWARAYVPPGAGEPIRLGDIAVSGEGTDLAIVTYGNGFYLCEQAAKILREQYGISLRVIDMRWLAPLPAEDILSAARPCGRVLIVDECRSTGSHSEALMALFAERTDQSVARIAAEDSFIATGPAFAATLPSRDRIIDAALTHIGVRPVRSRA